MSLLVHLKSETASNLACRELKSAFDRTCFSCSLVHLKVASMNPFSSAPSVVTRQSGVELGASACKACQLILWQLGDSQYGAKPPKYLEAVPFCSSFLSTTMRRTSCKTDNVLTLFNYQMSFRSTQLFGRPLTMQHCEFIRSMGSQLGLEADTLQQRSSVGSRVKRPDRKRS